MSPSSERHPDWPAKFHPRSHLIDALERLPRPWVFTNGVFDLLHRGHVSYLAKARSLGASLIVALNSDASVRLLDKGADRPVNPEMDRAWVIGALESVSLVTLFDEPNPLKLLQELKPDWYVKGGDYDMARLPEAELMRHWGGQSQAIDYLPGRSSSMIIKRLRMTGR
ncbi:MAG: D-glycero-beta-D-manno-heptose 1-phosphate adenylyltransferase [Rubrivivax sp.]|nr:MAG: D-glycero-beta-D-manno-heptose 1-phosphate adenylyltransferase [Rubrivivax sp.]